MNPERHDRPKIPRVEVYWTTITYRSVFLAILLILAAGLGGWYILHPKSFNSVVEKLTGSDTKEGPTTTVNRARFFALDGTVEVRKVNSMQWVTADIGMPLDKGDSIRTSGSGRARLSFPDGTTYTVNPDTVITVESDSAGQTQASMHISSGAVDLSTATNRAGISFENAVASVNQNSRAAVRSDPGGQSEITMSRGGGEVQRGGERVQIGQLERLTFKQGEPAITKTQVLASPQLAKPLNMSPFIAPNPRQQVVRFEWDEVPGAVEYLFRLGTSQMFLNVVTERRQRANSVELTGLEANEYFWAVTAYDAQKRASEPSDIFKFTLARQGGQSMRLELDGKPRLHGNVAEINGFTEPGATVIIMGQQVPRIGPDGKFQFFTPPLTRGAHKISVVAQNRRGGTARLDEDILVP